MLKIKAVGHRVIIKGDKVETQTKSGIVLAVDAKREAQAAQKGTVMDIGPMAWKNAIYGYGIEGWAPWVNVGDRVYFARYSGKLIRDGKLDDPNMVEYFIINDEDVQVQILDEGTEGDIDD